MQVACCESQAASCELGVRKTKREFKRKVQILTEDAEMASDLRKIPLVKKVEFASKKSVLDAKEATLKAKV